MYPGPHQPSQARRRSRRAGCGDGVGAGLKDAEKRRASRKLTLTSPPSPFHQPKDSLAISLAASSVSPKDTAPSGLILKMNPDTSAPSKTAQASSSVMPGRKRA